MTLSGLLIGAFTLGAVVGTVVAWINSKGRERALAWNAFSAGVRLCVREHAAGRHLPVAQPYIGVPPWEKRKRNWSKWEDL